MSELTTTNPEGEKFKQILREVIPPALAISLLLGITNTGTGEVASRAAATIGPGSNPTTLVAEAKGEAGAAAPEIS
jgi:hypothetical protein